MRLLEWGPRDNNINKIFYGNKTIDSKLHHNISIHLNTQVSWLALLSEGFDGFTVLPQTVDLKCFEINIPNKQTHLFHFSKPLYLKTILIKEYPQVHINMVETEMK